MGQAMLSRLFDLLAPPECASCQEPVRAGRAFCPGCAASVVRAADGRAAFLYGGALSRAVTRWKFEGALGVGTALCQLFAAEMRHNVPPGALLVPVPLHPRRLAERGFNPATLLARALARERAAKIRVEPELLRRIRDTPKQSLLGRAQRTPNVAGAFVANRRLPAAARVVLIDDVRTTGSTLRECRSALHAGGAETITTFVLAQALSHQQSSQ